MEQLKKYILWVSMLCGLGLIASYFFGFNELLSPLAVSAAVTFAIGIGGHSTLKSFQYTAWIIAAIICGLTYPDAILKVGDFDMRNKWLILIVVQMVMFGMGTQMSLRDFAGIKTMGKGVLVGLLCQFSIMPLLGFGLTKVFDFPPEIAAGIILIGSCSSGLASNVMVYIAGANLPLSVTLTAIATLIAPIMTPLLMELLAGTYIEIKFLDMCLQIVKIVIVPIGSAMIYDGMKTHTGSFKTRANLAAIVGLVWVAGLFFGIWSPSVFESSGIQLTVEMLGFLAGSVIFGVLFFYVVRLVPKLPEWMPWLSMFGIVYFTLVTTAASQENLMQIGLLLIIVAIIHNSLGYLFGYSFSRLLGMDQDSARTIALEVGLQNGGMASGLAGVMGKLATLGLASAVFSPWMNISGSLLANFWKRKS